VGPFGPASRPFALAPSDGPFTARGARHRWRADYGRFDAAMESRLHARTGKIWSRPSAGRLATVKRVCRTLERVYGRQRLGNPKNPVDDLVYIVVSNKTSPGTAERTFRQLKKNYRTWNQVLASPISKLRSILRPAGLSRVKSRQLWKALGKIKRDFGRCDLSRLSGTDECSIHHYLTSLPGVSDKVAKCVMMYAMGARVLPVDTHVHRIATRLGWTGRKRADQCHPELESLVPPRWRYVFHVGCVVHGRRICRPDRPLCQNCCIKGSCEYYKNKKDAA
jgi:endonuclease III